MRGKSCLGFLALSLGRALLLDAAVGLLTWLVCRQVGMRTLTNYADGLFIAGLAVICIGSAGFISSGEGLVRDPLSYYMQEKTASLSYEKRIRAMWGDRLQGNAFMLQVALAGVLLAGISIALYRIFHLG